MEENRLSRQRGAIVIPFLVGFVASVALGWLAYPRLMYTEKEQPFRFSHLAHQEAAMMSCEECHYNRDDGSYAGIPTTESCAECHAMPLGMTEEEAYFVENYVDTGKEVEWLVYQKQPDNVYFSHVAHEMFDCTECHPDVGNSDDMPPYLEHRLTGYTKQTMKMWKCERCHAESGASNACYICHM